jgi:hypothetical protein
MNIHHNYLSYSCVIFGTILTAFAAFKAFNTHTLIVIPQHNEAHAITIDLIDVEITSMNNTQRCDNAKRWGDINDVSVYCTEN